MRASSRWSVIARCWPFKRRLSPFGRASVLLATLLALNVALWTIAAIVFAHRASGALALAVVAWTLGLRHALDADHISIIDNVVRKLVQLGQRPISVGLYFSIGHSTIVVAVTLAIVISASAFDHLDAISSISGVVGSSISASLLFALAVINSVILYRALRMRKQIRKRECEREKVEHVEDVAELEKHGDEMRTFGCMARIVSPLVRIIDRPYKLFFVGLAMGLGFDTASEIALLGITALAQDSDIPNGSILLLPLLFAGGMSLVDSIDSVGMLLAYSTPGWRFFDDEDEDRETEVMAIKARTISDISIILTVMSIVVALCVSIIELMGIAADRQGDESSDWWRFWAAANDHFEFVGAGIAGAFLLVVAIFYCVKRLRSTLA